MFQNTVVLRVSILTSLLLVMTSTFVAAEPLEISLQVKHPEITRSTGKNVVINEVTDSREFGAAAATAGSSKESSPDVDDRAFNERLAGRLLAEKGTLNFLIVTDDQSIGSLIGDAVAEAYRRAGYRVVTKGSAAAADAIKVDVDVKRFWVWAESNPQVRRSYYFSSQIEATIQADAPPFGLPSLVGADIRARGKRPKDDVSWIRTGNRGIEDFIKNVATLLKYPPAGTINQ